MLGEFVKTFERGVGRMISQVFDVLASGLEPDGYLGTERNAITAFSPPKANEFDSAALTFCARA
jgi:hypothetical protein